MEFEKKDKIVDVSIIIPAFNEEKRLPLFLERLISYCNYNRKIYEIIVVDDGSSDKTFEIATSYKKSFPNLFVIKNITNRGKGYTVKRGVLYSSGKISLYMDADGSVEPKEIEKNLVYILRDGYNIVVGSRAFTSKDTFLKTKFYRKLIGIVFNFFVQTILFKAIKDTQCGFKIFKREVAISLFSKAHIDKFGFDIEILYLAHKWGYRVKEVPISWHHVDGSKINLFTDSVRMFFNILQVKNYHYASVNPLTRPIGQDEYTFMYDLECYHWWFIARKNLVKELILSLNFLFPTILDVGCGTGGNLLLFNKIGRAFGIDNSAEAIKYCKQRGFEDTIQCPAEKIKYDNKTFDIITLLDVLEHVMNPVQVLTELKRVLKDEGKIIITVPAFMALWSQHDEALNHLRRYSKFTLWHDLNEAGLKIDKVGHSFFLPFFIIAPVRFIRKFFLNSQKLRSETAILPPKFINSLFKKILNIENKFLINFRLPFGTTLYAIVSKQS